ncbi:MAG: beta-ketoacyl-ACP synthase III [bacterium]
MTHSIPVRLTGTGLFTPSEKITNEELVASFNQWVDEWNAENPDNPKEHSSAAFIEKASGIKSRYVLNKSGILDTKRMRPQLPRRDNSELSIMAEIGVAAAKQAIEKAGLLPGDIDAVICGASNMQRAYPAMAVEIQNALGIDGYGYDMNVACASASFAIQNAVGLIQTGAKHVLTLNPEICSAHLNFRDRDAHFIFGDVATASIISRADESQGDDQWDIIGTSLKTIFSNNIRNNFGFLSHTSDELDISDPNTDQLFQQEGRKVFKDVVPMVAMHIANHLSEHGLAGENLKRMWLHQANLAMNEFIARKVLGRDATKEEAPVVLDEYANTSSAGSIIAFHKYHDDFKAGDIGVISGFGAGYSAGSIIVRKV